MTGSLPSLTRRCLPILKLLSFASGHPSTSDVVETYLGSFAQPLHMFDTATGIGSVPSPRKDRPKLVFN